jgi:DNA-binding response OmpR family regulator
MGGVRAAGAPAQCDNRQIPHRGFAVRIGAEVDSNTVEVYVSRPRKKLGRDAITTVRGASYKISA